jgi:hypothetical protein
MVDTRVRKHGYERLARDLDAVELLLHKRPGATKRLHRELGVPFADGLVASLRSFHVSGAAAPALAVSSGVH